MSLSRIKVGKLLILLAAAALPAFSQTQPVDVGIALSKDAWIRCYGGYDYSLLGDLVNGTKGFNALEVSEGRNSTAATDTSGLVGGLELGIRLGPDDDLSLTAERIKTQDISVSAGSEYFSDDQEIRPSVGDLTLSWIHYFLQSKGSRTYFSLGGGVYRAMVGYYLNQQSTQAGDSFYFTETSNLTGTTVGGTLSLGEEVALGKSFSLGLSVRGRLVSFSQVTSPTASVVGTANAGVGGGPYALFLDPNSGGQPVVGMSSVVYFPQLPGTRYAVLDYSGLDGNLSLAFHF